MRNLLTPADRDRLAAPLARRLARQVALGDRSLLALPEAEGADAFAAEENGLAAELLLQPGIRESWPELAEGVLDFLLALAEPPVPCLRYAPPSLEIRRDDPRDFEILTPFHRFTGNLALGVLRQQLRRGEAVSPPVLHSGNLVEFSLGRRASTVDAEDGIARFALTREGDRVVLTHETPVQGEAGLLFARRTEAGTLAYRYEIGAGSPVLRVEVSFQAARAVTGLRLTTGADALASDGGALGAARIGTAAGWRDAAVPETPGVVEWHPGTAMEHLALGEPGWPERGTTLHIRPAEPARVMAVTSTTLQPGRLHWVLLRHGPAELPQGGRLTVREDRLLAGAVAPERAQAAMRATPLGVDLAPDGPPGAALNAVATALLLDAAGAWAEPLPDERRAQLTAWLAASLATAAPSGLVDLAFATLAADGLARIGGDAAPVRRLAERLVARLGDDGVFRDARDAPATLRGHAAGLLALARAGAWLPALATAIEAALSAIAVQPGEALGLPGGAPMPDLAEAAALGMVARAAGAAVLAGEALAPPLAEAAMAQAREIHRTGVALIRPLVRPVSDGLEVAPSAQARGLSTPAQVAVALALLAPDARLIRAGVGAA
jgi:hypothetical protein